MSNELRESLRKLCEALNQNNVQCMLVGGVAVGFYGYERQSMVKDLGRPELVHDIDFWYNPTITNFTNLVQALKTLGVDTESLSDYVFDPNKTFLRIPFGTFRAEFLPNMPGLESFATCFKRAKRIKFDGNELVIIGYDDLIVNKKTLGRDVDRQDIEQLQKRNPRGPQP
ncbi:MAG TPA: nucleotidyltransferase [Cyclobacteriaceae bacterium]|jgi:hypothetical protein